MKILLLNNEKEIKKLTPSSSQYYDVILLVKNKIFRILKNRYDNCYPEEVYQIEIHFIPFLKKLLKTKSVDIRIGNKILKNNKYKTTEETVTLIIDFINDYFNEVDI